MIQPINHKADPLKPEQKKRKIYEIIHTYVNDEYSEAVVSEREVGRYWVRHLAKTKNYFKSLKRALAYCEFVNEMKREI